MDFIIELLIPWILLAIVAILVFGLYRFIKLWDRMKKQTRLLLVFIVLGVLSVAGLFIHHKLIEPKPFKSPNLYFLPPAYEKPPAEAPIIVFLNNLTLPETGSVIF